MNLVMAGDGELKKIHKKRWLSNNIAHTSSELLKTEMQNQYFSTYKVSPEALAIAGRW